MAIHRTHQRTSSSNNNNQQLPAIICLHGSGSNTTVFKIQCRRLTWALNSQFRFIFVEAPFHSEPGHGMVPIFESCAPFFRWSDRRWNSTLEHDVMPEGEVELVQKVLDDAVAKEYGSCDEKGWENVVGVLGFSMGARLASGLLLRQLLKERRVQQRLRQQQEDSEEEEGAIQTTGAKEDVIGRCKTSFKFGVFIGSPFVPLSPTSGYEPTMLDYELLKTIPTVHAWGMEDFVRDGAERLADVCESKVSSTLEFEGGHHLPLIDVEASDLCELIRSAWYARGGRAQEYWRRQMQA